MQRTLDRVRNPLVGIEAKICDVDRREVERKRVSVNSASGVIGMVSNEGEGAEMAENEGQWDGDGDSLGMKMLEVEVEAYKASSLIDGNTIFIDLQV